jgi:hypothetical protein
MACMLDAVKRRVGGVRRRQWLIHLALNKGGQYRMATTKEQFSSKEFESRPPLYALESLYALAVPTADIRF